MLSGSERALGAASLRLRGLRLIEHLTLFSADRGHLMTTGGREAKPDLEGIVDEPLERGEGSDHDDSGRKPIPETGEADVAVDSAHGFRGGLAGLAVRVELADHDVCRVRDDRTRDARDVPAQEAHAGLLQLVVALLRPAQLLVDVVDGLFEGGEFTHGVGDLAAPQRRDALVEARDALLLDDLGPALTQRVGVRRERGLHADLDGLEGAEEDVGDELGTGAGSQVYQRAVRAREQIVTVDVLEHLVEPVLAHPLEAVPDQRRRPPEEHPPDPLVRKYRPPRRKVARVQLRVHLSSCLDQIQWSHQRVRRPACHDAAQHA